MLSKEALIVLRHYLEEGLSQTTIARKLGVSRRTVYRYRQSAKKEPSYGPRPGKPSLLDPFRAYIRGRLEAYPELSAVRLLDEVRALGYAGRYTMVRQLVRAERPRLPRPFEVRFEVEPAQQAQLDFATFKTPFGTVYALLVVLSWSRQLWVRFSFHQDQLTVLAGMHRAFVAFGGVPRTVLFDRMKTAVASSREDGTAVFNEEMLRFAAYCGFKPVACRPYRAKTKGRVERAVSYLRQSFFYGRSFRDLDDLNAQCERWLAETANVRIHGTTGVAPRERLGEEREHLLPLPTSAYAPLVILRRRVSKDGFVSYNGNEYSVPSHLGQAAEVQVRPTLEELWLLHDGEPVAVHPLLEGRGLRCLAPEHAKSRRPQGLQALREQPPAEWELVQVERRSLEVYEEVLA